MQATDLDPKTEVRPSVTKFENSHLLLGDEGTVLAGALKIGVSSQLQPLFDGSYVFEVEENRVGIIVGREECSWSLGGFNYRVCFCGQTMEESEEFYEGDLLPAENMVSTEGFPEGQEILALLRSGECFCSPAS